MQTYDLFESMCSENIVRLFTLIEGAICGKYSIAIIRSTYKHIDEILEIMKIRPSHDEHNIVSSRTNGIINPDIPHIEGEIAIEVLDDMNSADIKKWTYELVSLVAQLVAGTSASPL